MQKKAPRQSRGRPGWGGARITSDRAPCWQTTATAFLSHGGNIKTLLQGILGALVLSEEESGVRHENMKERKGAQLLCSASGGWPGRAKHRCGEKRRGKGSNIEVLRIPTGGVPFCNALRTSSTGTMTCLKAGSACIGKRGGVLP